MTQTLPVYALLVQELIAAGVSMVSGLMAEDTAVLTSEIASAGIVYRPAKHENVAVTIADGYAWAGGGLGVVLLGRGPGLTNGGTALATLVHGRRSVVVVSTVDSHAQDARSEMFKAMNQSRFAEAVGLEYLVPQTAEQVVSTFRSALACAHAGRPALFALPLELMDAQAPVAPPSDEATPAVPVEPAAGDVERLVELIEESERPLVLAGVGAIAARDALVALAERIGGLLTTSLLAKDLFLGHQLDLRIMGGYCTDTARELAREADYVFAFGASVNQWTRGHGLRFPHARIVAVDRDAAQLGRLGPVDLGVVGDALLTAEAVLRRLPSTPRAGALFHRPETLARVANPVVWAQDNDSNEEAIDPRRLSLLLDELLPPERQVVTDGGHFTYFPAIGIHGAPLTFRQTLEFVAVGMGIGTAMGAAIARPQLATVLVVGDGGLAMTLGDLEPLVHFEHPIIVVVYNDQAYGAERHGLDLDGRPHELAKLPDVDFARVAEGMGIEGVTVRTADELRRLAPSLGHRRASIVVDCKVNPAVRGSYVEEGKHVAKGLAAAVATD